MPASSRSDRSTSPLACLLALGGLAGCDPASDDTANASAHLLGPPDPLAPPVQPADRAPSPAQVRAVVDAMLRSAYGEDSFDASRACWRHTFDGATGPRDYCMRVATPQVLPGERGPEVYVLTYSDPEAGRYAQDEPGLQGLFAAQASDDGTWTPLAASPAIGTGRAGDCGCRHDAAIEVGPGRYGWLSIAGDAWQGAESSAYALRIAEDGAFREVSRIPRASRDAPGEFNTLEVDRSGAPVAGMYPLKVTRRRGDTLLGTRAVAFDPARGSYPWTP
ncbi:hypothetical protein LDO32_00650 [Luteimonas sp. Y-2-2-4F]|nr:hypothetical protein [Luteimonas sp. Y-2-2-4F]MCD9030245.1 hypothetical protein [Luteimonas sp. Y-2-2-4F]